MRLDCVLQPRVGILLLVQCHEAVYIRMMEEEDGIEGRDLQNQRWCQPMSLEKGL